MALSIWTPNGIVDVGNGGPAYSAGNSPTSSYNSSNASLFSPKTPSVVSIPDQVIGGGSKFGPSEAWTPGAGNPPVTVSPTNVGNPLGYGMSIPDNGAGTMPSGDDRKAYEDAMAKTYANVVTSPGLFGTDIGKQTGYTGQGSQSRAGIRAPSNSNTGGGAVSGGGSRAQSTGPAPIPQVLISQDLAQRQQTGNIYAPDLSAYNDSSLFNYTGPGGVDEYTYGQGLRTDGADYSIFGSPTDIANPYYEGQFAPKPTGPADGAIGMNPVQLPSNLPQIEVSADVSMPGFVGGGNQVIGGSLPTDLTYQQTIDSMGIFGPDNPPPSTTFPSPGDNTGLTQNMTASDKEYQDMLNQSLMMDNQLMNQLDSSKPVDSSMMDNQAQADMAMGDRSGFPNDNRVIEASIPGMTMDDTAAIEQGMAAPETFMSGGSPNGRGGFDLYYDRDDVPKMALTPENITEAASERAKRESEQFLARDVAEGMSKNLNTLMEQGTRLQTMYDNSTARQQAGERENLLQNQDVEAANYQRALDAQKIEIDKQRYNTQINNPTADFSGYMRNYGDGGGFKEPAPVESLFKIEPSVQREIASRVASGGEAEGNELMLEAIGLGNVFTGSKVSSPEKKKAEAEIVSIFAGGPSRKSVKSEPAVVKSAPRVKVDYNKNKPVAVKKTKPTPRGPQPVKVTRTTGSRGSRGSSSKPKSSSPSRSYSVGQSAYRRGNR